MIIFRSCRELLKHHDALENELSQCSHRVDNLVGQSQNLSDEGHFDSDSIKKHALLSQQRLKDLYIPAQKRRAALEEALQFYKFEFELNNELQWIKEHLPLASSEDLGQNLHLAQLLHKKHKKLYAEIEGHQPVIDKCLENGQALVRQKHLQHEQVNNDNNKKKFSFTFSFFRLKNCVQILLMLGMT